MTAQKKAKKLSSAEEGQARLDRLKYALQLFRLGYTIKEAATKAEIELDKELRKFKLSVKRIEKKARAAARKRAQETSAGVRKPGPDG
jgi:hypothetical protein